MESLSKDPFITAKKSLASANTVSSMTSEQKKFHELKASFSAHHDPQRRQPKLPDWSSQYADATQLPQSDRGLSADELDKLDSMSASERLRFMRKKRLEKQRLQGQADDFLSEVAVNMMKKKEDPGSQSLDNIDQEVLTGSKSRVVNLRREQGITPGLKSSSKSLDPVDRLDKISVIDKAHQSKILDSRPTFSAGELKSKVESMKVADSIKKDVDFEDEETDTRDRRLLNKKYLETKFSELHVKTRNTRDKNKVALESSKNNIRDLIKSDKVKIKKEASATPLVKRSYDGQITTLALPEKDNIDAAKNSLQSGVSAEKAEEASKQHASHANAQIVPPAFFLPSSLGHIPAAIPSFYGLATQSVPPTAIHEGLCIPLYCAHPIVLPQDPYTNAFASVPTTSSMSQSRLGRCASCHGFGVDLVQKNGICAHCHRLHANASSAFRTMHERCTSCRGWGLHLVQRNGKCAHCNRSKAEIERPLPSERGQNSIVHSLAAQTLTESDLQGSDWDSESSSSSSEWDD